MHVCSQIDYILISKNLETLKKDANKKSVHPKPSCRLHCLVNFEEGDSSVCDNGKSAVSGVEAKFNSTGAKNLTDPELEGTHVLILANT